MAMTKAILFFLRVYLLAILGCAGVGSAFGSLPMLFYVVLFPAITVAAMLVCDWFDRNVDIVVRVRKK
jgi:4-hydroxybenzoate polyprenyltransferase